MSLTSGHVSRVFVAVLHGLSCVLWGRRIEPHLVSLVFAARCLSRLLPAARATPQGIEGNPGSDTKARKGPGCAHKPPTTTYTVSPTC
jgi:hypothetical protein